MPRILPSNSYVSLTCMTLTSRHLGYATKTTNQPTKSPTPTFPHFSNNRFSHSKHGTITFIVIAPHNIDIIYQSRTFQAIMELPKPRPTFLITLLLANLFLLLLPKTQTLALDTPPDGARTLHLSSFCDRATSNTTITTCPAISTFDLIDMTAYAGLWYEIGSTAQFKLTTSAGMSRVETNYTVIQTTSSSDEDEDHHLHSTTTISAVNSGVRTLGPIATTGVAGINRGAKDVCQGVRDVCSSLGSQSDLMQSVNELYKVAYLLADDRPDLSPTLTSVAKQVQGYAFNISRELPMLARHVKEVQVQNGYLNEANGTAKARVEQLRLDLNAISKHVGVIVEFVNDMATARKCLVEVALKLVMGREFVNSVDVTEASLIIAGAEQSILVSTKLIEESVSGMRTASELILADLNRPMEEVAWDIPAIATQNETSRAKLQFSIMGLSVPYWIVALEGAPSHGYKAALVYSCMEDLVVGTIEQSFFVLSRTPTIQPAILERFINVAVSLGIDLECENPFLQSTYANSPDVKEAPTPITCCS